MSKGKQRPPMYNRQSKGYQQNIYKKQMKEKNIELPKSIDMDKWGRINKIVGVVLIVLVFVVGFLVSWKWSLLVVAAGAIYMVAFYMYVNNYMKKYLGAYKKMGIPKEIYIRQLEKSGADVKNVQRMSKMWDKIKVED
jgi:hypothetical protein